MMKRRIKLLKVGLKDYLKDCEGLEEREERIDGMNKIGR